MKFFFPAMIIGALINLFLFSPDRGMEIYPEWHGHVSGQVETSGSNRYDSLDFFVRNGNTAYILKGSGRIGDSVDIGQSLAAFSGDGKHYVLYQKVGEEIEFYNIKAEPFWKQRSLEYPSLSYRGKLIFLMAADQSRIRIIDNNGNEIGQGTISGRTSTAMAFSEKSDFGAIGFLDGRYYLINDQGIVINSGKAPAGCMVKGLAISVNGEYLSVHYGDTGADFIRIIDVPGKSHDLLPLKRAHQVKTAMHVTDDGYVTVLDGDAIVYASPSGKVKYRITVPTVRPGTSSISFEEGVYCASYTMASGISKLIVFRDDGIILLSKEFPSETFLTVNHKGDLIFLRGSDNLFCYSIHR